MTEHGENGNGNGRLARQVITAMFLMLVAGFGALSVRNFYATSDNSERLRGVEIRLEGFEKLMNARTDERYRSSDALRDFGFDRAAIMEIKARLVELERHR